ncbi:MAG TPA: MFS transporter [Acidimicrobiales bacterium]|nr:MFS transporter [Acidimicrobiales bacterium]
MAADSSPTEPPGLYTWRQAPVVSVAALASASGFGQFGAVAALADVADAFGEATGGATVAEQAGLSGTVLGVGLALIRLASLGAMPLAGLGDRFGRSAVLLWCAAVGLALVALGALSPGYWWFVAAFGLSRPFLSASNALAQVVAGEHTASADRAKAGALVVAGYGLGAALVATVRGAAGAALGFRGTFALAVVPLLLLPLLARWVTEPARYRATGKRHTEVHTVSRSPAVVLGRLHREGRRRLIALLAVAFCAAFVTGPANSFIFVYAEGILDVSASVTAAMFLAAVPMGLVGLMVGRWGADRWGRRPTAALALAGIGLAAMVTYGGGLVATIVGSLLAVLTGYAFAPTVATLANELFPTDVRASVAGWLVSVGVVGAVGGLLVFGAMADLLDGFAAAAVVVSVPGLMATLAFLRLPETMGMELEESAAFDGVDASPY